MELLDKNRLQRYLLASGIPSVLELSRRADLNKNTLLPYLQGRRGIYAEPISKIAAVLGIDPGDLCAARSSGNFFERAARFLESRIGPDRCIVLFGSRSRNSAKPYSDFDLGIFSLNEKLSADRYLILKSDLEDHLDDEAYGADLQNLDQAPNWFLESIGNDLKLAAGSSAAFYKLQGVIDGLQRQQD